MLGPGDPAPSFALDGVEGDGATRRRFSSEEWLGAPVVLVFYPADKSLVCTMQLRSYTDDIGAFAAVGAQVVALSPQSVDDHVEFVRNNDAFAFPLLSDIDKQVGRAFGTLGPLGFYRRSIVVLDGEGVIRWAHRAAAGLTFRPVSEIVEVVRSLG